PPPPQMPAPRPPPPIAPPPPAACAAPPPPPPAAAFCALAKLGTATASARAAPIESKARFMRNSPFSTLLISSKTLSNPAMFRRRNIKYGHEAATGRRARCSLSLFADHLATGTRSRIFSRAEELLFDLDDLP